MFQEFYAPLAHKKYLHQLLMSNTLLVVVLGGYCWIINRKM